MGKQFILWVAISVLLVPAISFRGEDRSPPQSEFLPGMAWWSGTGTGTGALGLPP